MGRLMGEKALRAGVASGSVGEFGVAVREDGGVRVVSLGACDAQG